MNYSLFEQHLKQLSEISLGGLSSQLKMIPEGRPVLSWEEISLRKPRSAGVLALFYPDSFNNTTFLLTLRASYKGVHADQISFPGGKMEKHDKDLAYTALRETHEETGVVQNDVSLIRQITNTYIPPSNFLVHTFMGTIPFKPEFKKNHEVEKILEVSVSELLDERSLTTKKMATSYMKEIDIPCFQLSNHVVWGATAMMLSEIKDLLKSI